VFVVDTSDGKERLLAYELKSGKTRWSKDLVPGDGWPWYVEDGVLYTLWSNLALLSTKDGSVIWRTDYPVVDVPRMTNVRTNDKLLFVSFTSVPAD
jgi:hypothetical protein